MKGLFSVKWFQIPKMNKYRKYFLLLVLSFIFLSPPFFSLVMKGHKWEHYASLISLSCIHIFSLIVNMHKRPICPSLSYFPPSFLFCSLLPLISLLMIERLESRFATSHPPSLIESLRIPYVEWDYTVFFLNEHSRGLHEKRTWNLKNWK